MNELDPRAATRPDDASVQRLSGEDPSLLHAAARATTPSDTEVARIRPRAAVRRSNGWWIALSIGLAGAAYAAANLQLREPEAPLAPVVAVAPPSPRSAPTVVPLAPEPALTPPEPRRAPAPVAAPEPLAPEIGRAHV